MDLIVYKYNTRLDCGVGHCVIISQRQNGAWNFFALLKKCESETLNIGKEGYVLLSGMNMAEKFSLKEIYKQYKIVSIKED